MSSRLLVLLLSLMLGVQPLTTDLYLPALSDLTRGFASTPAQAQLTLAGLLLAFGFSQLVWGPLADRFGRRPILLSGVGLYTVASLGCALAGSMTALIVWRILQGAAMGAAVMGARAIVRDAYSPQQGARAMSQALTGLGIMACLSAPVGGWLAEHLGWRWTLGTLAVFGLALTGLLAWRFRETLPAAHRAPLRPRALAASWWAILRHPTFQAGSALSVCSYAGLFTFLAASPFVLMRVLGLTATQFGLALFSSSLSYVLGTFLCRRLLPRFGLRRCVVAAGAVTLVSGSCAGLLALAGVRSVWALLVPFWFFMLAHGIHQPCGQTGAVSPFPKAAGAAAALNGFLMMLAAFAVGAWLGQRLDDTVLPLANGLWFWSACITLVAWTLMRRHGELRPD